MLVSLPTVIFYINKELPLKNLLFFSTLLSIVEYLYLWSVKISLILVLLWGVWKLSFIINKFYNTIPILLQILTFKIANYFINLSHILYLEEAAINFIERRLYFKELGWRYKLAALSAIFRFIIANERPSCRNL